jgi:hypothetical protein
MSVLPNMEEWVYYAKGVGIRPEDGYKLDPISKSLQEGSFGLIPKAHKTLIALNSGEKTVIAKPNYIAVEVRSADGTTVVLQPGQEYGYYAFPKGGFEEALEAESRGRQQDWAEELVHGFYLSPIYMTKLDVKVNFDLLGDDEAVENSTATDGHLWLFEAGPAGNGSYTPLSPLFQHVPVFSTDESESGNAPGATNGNEPLIYFGSEPEQPSLPNNQSAPMSKEVYRRRLLASLRDVATSLRLMVSSSIWGWYFNGANSISPAVLPRVPSTTPTMRRVLRRTLLRDFEDTLCN